MRILKRFTFAILAVLFVAWAVTSWYYLPKHDKVHISGTEVKREDVTLKGGGTETRDVRFVTAKTLDGSSEIYRNEDAGWWPPYFKFDSGDVAASAANLAKEDDKTVVLVRYYGMRSPILSLYPNIISLEKMSDPDQDPFPVYTFIYLAICFALLVLCWVMFRKIKRFKPFKKKDGAAGPSVTEPTEPA